MPRRPQAEIPADLSTLLELSAITPGQHPKKEDAPLPPEDTPLPNRYLPDEDDPVKQPMPSRDPRDPAPVPPDPDNPPPPNGDPKEDSGPVDEDDDLIPLEPDEIIPPPYQPAAMPGSVIYESRITIVAAFQYPGNLKGAPAWVDRNWIGFGDYDQVRDISAGPCLRVPLSSGVSAVARIGDYVCKQQVTLAPGLPADERIEVWERSQFEKLFVPTRPDHRSEGPPKGGTTEGLMSSLQPTLGSRDVLPAEA